MVSSYPVTVVRGVPVVTAPARIDASNASRLRAALLDTVLHGHATFVVDMSATQFCDAAGLHVLVRAHKHAQCEGGEARLVITSVAVLRTFGVTGIDRVIPNFASLREALEPTPAIAILPAYRAAPGNLPAGPQAASPP